MARPAISTGTGDDGTTGLFRGERVAKSDLRIHAIGTIDELNAILGVVIAEHGLPQELREPIDRVQHALFKVGADIADPGARHLPSPRHPGLRQTSRLSAVFIGELEQWGAAMERQLPTLSQFIIPGGSRIAALLHQARAVCRRAERWVVGLAQEEMAGGSERSRGVNPEVRVYLNRLSDCLFLAARMANQSEDHPEIPLTSPASGADQAHSRN